MANWHILPINDTEEHEKLSTCKCQPEVQILEEGDLLVIHNSFDGREAIEMFNEIVNK